MSVENMGTWWNHISLDQPPFLVYPTKNYLACCELRKLINKKMKLLGRMPLRIETAILKRLMFRLNSQFRRSKKYQIIRKLRQCLTKFEQVDIDKAYETLSTAVPDGEIDEESDLTLGSRQMFEFVITKTLSVVHLLRRSCDHCFSAIELIKSELQLGHFVSVNVVLFSCLSRMWVLCAYVTFNLVKLYDEMYQLLTVIQPAPVSWIPAGESLPRSLEPFLSSGSLQLVYEKSKCENDDLSSLLAKTFEENKDIPLIISKTFEGDSNVEAEPTVCEIDKVNLQIENIGTLVPRSLYATETADTMSKERLKYDFEQVHTRKQVIAWLKEETKKLIISSPTIASLLPLSSWKILRKCIRDAFLSTPKSSESLEWAKETIVKWFDKPKKCLKLYKSGKLKP